MGKLSDSMGEIDFVQEKETIRKINISRNLKTEDSTMLEKYLGKRGRGSETAEVDDMLIHPISGQLELFDLYSQVSFSAKP